MMSLWTNFLNLFFPPLCVVCKSRLNTYEFHVCTNCILHLPKTNFHNQLENRLVDFFAGRFPFVNMAAYAYFIKGGSIQKIIHELKYNQNREIGVFIGELYGNDLRGSDFISSIDYIVPIPLHPKREKKRGYNQSLEIAEGIANKTGLTIDSTMLKRIVNNESQTKNSRFERWENVENIFLVTDRSVFEGKHILLIDDVITTGSTIESCAKEILKCKNAKISILAFAIAT